MLVVLLLRALLDLRQAHATWVFLGPAILVRRGLVHQLLKDLVTELLAAVLEVLLVSDALARGDEVLLLRELLATARRPPAG